MRAPTPGLGEGTTDLPTFVRQPTGQLLSVRPVLAVAYSRVMKWRRRDSGRSNGGDVEIYSIGHGLVVQGTTTDISAFIDEMMSITTAAGGRSRHVVSGVIEDLQVVANVAALRQTHREYIEFSDRAATLLRQHGAIPTDDGYFRSFVHDGKRLAGHLDWRPVDLSPERALSLQAFAGQMALRAAVHDVVAAMARIEGKIDQIAALARAERLGAVIADRATLLPMVQRWRSAGRSSQTDWATIAPLGPWIARDIATLRSYIVEQLRDVSKSWTVRSRSSDAEGLTDQLVIESLALLVVAEQNYALWQELRIGHAAVHERAALPGITAAVRDALEALSTADQALVHQLSATLAQLTSPTGLEGLAPLKKRTLTQHAEQLAAMTTWFAQQRNLDVDDAELPHYPGLTNTLARLGHAVSATIRSAKEQTPEVGQHWPMKPPPTQGGDWPQPTKTVYPMKPHDRLLDNGALHSGALGRIKAEQHHHKVVVEWTGEHWIVRRVPNPRVDANQGELQKSADANDQTTPASWQGSR